MSFILSPSRFQNSHTQTQKKSHMYKSKSQGGCTCGEATDAHAQTKIIKNNLRKREREIEIWRVGGEEKLRLRPCGAICYRRKRNHHPFIPFLSLSFHSHLSTLLILFAFLAFVRSYTAHVSPRIPPSWGRMKSATGNFPSSQLHKNLRLSPLDMAIVSHISRSPYSVSSSFIVYG